MSTGLIVLLCLVLFVVIAVQLSKLSELGSRIRGEEHVDIVNTNRNAWGFLIYGVLFLLLTIGSAWYYKNYMLGYGPHESASAHGGALDSMFNLTLFFTGIVFVITHIALFWFTFKYRYSPNRRANFFSHDNKLELVWTIVPTLVLIVLVLKGLVSWNQVMADVKPDEDYMEIEATGMQFAWLVRYPGEDGKLGSKSFTKISGLNPLGQDWTDAKNLDDFQPAEIVLPVNKKVKVHINSRDVLHSFDLPHFRVKLDAVPGIPTRFIFTPTVTTQEYRERLSKYPEYQVPSDPNDPDGPQLWETFEYELACAELCGKGHFSMKKIVRVVTEEEYERWLSEQKSYYLTTIRNSDEDPYKGQLLNTDIKARKAAFESSFKKAMEAKSEEDRVIRLEYVNFETGSTQLTPDSKYELENIAEMLLANPDISAELRGHTDNTGDAAANLQLSQQRAEAVKAFLMSKGVAGNRLKAKGYGQTRPIDTNETEEGRANNRRTEIKI